jgi:hypothetical protein
MVLFGAVWVAAGAGDGLVGATGVVVLVVGWVFAAALCIPLGETKTQRT